MPHPSRPLEKRSSLNPRMRPYHPLRRTLLFAICVFTFSGFVSTSFGEGKEDLIRDTDRGGIHKKLIIAAEGVGLYDAVDGNVTATLQPFEIFFQMWPSDSAKASLKESQDGWIRIGNARGEEAGWLKGDKVKDPSSQQLQAPLIPWSTRFFLDPKPQTDPNAPTFTIDFTEDGKDNTVRFVGQGADRKAIAPILDDTSEGGIYQVAFFLGDARSEASATSVVQEDMNAADFSLDLVFVIDTTASMTPLIDATKDVVRQCVDELQQRNPELQQSVRFGLVTYQDATPGLKPFDIVCPLTDAVSFQSKLAPLTVATQGSEEVSEDVLAGLAAAISPSMGWKPQAAKHVVLLGDASAHLTGPKNTTGETIESVLAASQQQAGGELENNLASVTFSAVRAQQAYNDPVEDSLCQEQFALISSNGGGAAGLSLDIDPNVPAQKADAIRQLVDFYRIGLQSLGGAQTGNAQVVAAAAATKKSAIATQFYQLLNAIGSATIPPVLEGTAADRDEDGNLVALKKVFVSKSEIKRLSSVLGFLHESLKQQNDAGERGDVAIVMHTLQTAVALTAAGEKGTQFGKDVSLRSVISELPLKSNALEITIQDLASMPDDEFTAWLAKLESTMTTAKKIAEEPDDKWQSLNEGSDRSDDLMFQALRLEDLP